jgi:hypothetical protein
MLSTDRYRTVWYRSYEKHRASIILTCYFSDSAVEINILIEYGTGTASVDLPTHTEPMNRFHFDSEFGIFMNSDLVFYLNEYMVSTNLPVSVHCSLCMVVHYKVTDYLCLGS